MNTGRKFIHGFLGLLIAWILSVTWLVPEAYAESSEELLAQGNAAYDQGNFEAASDLYEKAIRQGRFTAALFYNLGNAYFRQNQLGKAILNYERAKLLAPNDPDINGNLKFAREKANVEIQKQGKLIQLAGRLASFPWDWSGAAAFWLLMVLLLATWGWQRAARLKWISLVKVICILIIVLSITVSWLEARHAFSPTRAIVVGSSVYAHPEPRTNAERDFQIPEGNEVRIVDSHGNWVKIHWTKDLHGWVLIENAVPVLIM